MRDAFTPTILKTLHEKEIKELVDRAMDQKNPRFRIDWWWLQPRGSQSPTDDKAAKAQREAMEKETRRILTELARTDAGFQLLKDLQDANPQWAVITSWDGPKNDT